MVERRRVGGAVEVLMLAGAWIAPFNFLIRPPIVGQYLPWLHMWAFATLLVLLAVERDRLLAAFDWPALAFWTTFVFIALSTLLATPAEFRNQGLGDVRVLFLNLVAFTVVRGYYADRPQAWARFITHLGISSVLMAGGLIVRAVIVGSAQQAVGEDSYALGLGTIAGTFTAAFAAASAAVVVFATTRRQLVAGIVAFVAHGNAMVFALARGPWLAFAVAIVTMIPLAAWRFGHRFSIRRIAARGIAVLLALPVFFRVAIVVSPFIRGLLVQRVVEVVNLEAGTGFSRLVMWQHFLHDAGRSPVFGHGAAAYRVISESLHIEGTVSENFLVEILHAGGAVSFLFLVVGLVGVAVHCLFKPGASRAPALTAASLTGATALVLGSMTNPAGWDSLFWIMLGLAASRPVASTRAALESSVAG